MVRGLGGRSRCIIFLSLGIIVYLSVYKVRTGFWRYLIEIY